MRICSLLILATIVGTPIAVHAAEPSGQNWSNWRGPAAHGSTNTGHYPAGWSQGNNLLWKTSLPGIGCSTPIVWDEQIILTSPLDDQDAVISYDWSGKKLWQTKVGNHRKGKHRNGSGCNPSAVTDGQFIFSYFKSGNLAGLTIGGELLWSTNLQERFGKDTLYWDMGTSPIVTEDAVVVAVMHHGESFLIAFNKESGKQLWKSERNYKTPVEGDHSYATPILKDIAGVSTIVTWGAEHVTGHDATTGKLLWSVADFNPNRKGNWVVVASAVIVDDMIVVPYGRGSHLAGVKLGGSGDMTAKNRIWTRDDTGTFVPTPVAYNGNVYLVRDKGEVECIDPKTGKTIWTGAFPKHRAKFYSSPVIADEKIYAAREDGVVLVASIKDGFKLESENDMGERVIASPVPVRSKLLIRGEKHLYCYEGTNK